MIFNYNYGIGSSFAGEAGSAASSAGSYQQAYCSGVQYKFDSTAGNEGKKGALVKSDSYYYPESIGAVSGGSGKTGYLSAGASGAGGGTPAVSKIGQTTTYEFVSGSAGSAGGAGKVVIYW